MKPTKIKVGGQAIRIFHGENKGYPLHTVAWHVGAQRQRKTFADPTEARRFAENVLKPAIRKNELLGLKLTGADREAYVHAIELLKPLGMPLSVAVEDYVKRKQGVKDRPLDEVVEEFLESRGDHSKPYQETLRSYLKRFAGTFHYKIAGITTAMMTTWIDGLKLSRRSRRNARQSLVVLFHFAQRRGYLPKNVPTEADDIETAKGSEAEIGILTPAQLSKLLEILDGRAELYVWLGAFTGIRSAELLKLNWSNFRSDPGYIHIDAKIAKTGAQRYVPVLPNLAEFLAPHSRGRGPLFGSRRLVDRITRIAKENGIPWPNNCLRHSYASYRIANTQNWNQVADEMGTSYEKLKKNYRKPIKPETGKAWFSIEPPKRSEKIVAFAQASP